MAKNWNLLVEERRKKIDSQVNFKKVSHLDRLNIDMEIQVPQGGPILKNGPFHEFFKATKFIKQ